MITSLPKYFHIFFLILMAIGKGRTIPHFTDMETEAPGHVVWEWSGHSSFPCTFRSGHSEGGRLKLSASTTPGLSASTLSD